MLVRLSRVSTSRHRYSALSPSGFGGLPAPSFHPRLKGRNHDALPLRCVQKRTSFSSTAKCATQRPNSKSFSRGIPVLACIAHTASLDGLLRQVVLQLQGEDRQSVDEEPEVERPLGLVAAVAELPGHGEAVLLEPLPGLHVLRRGRAVEQVYLMGAVSDAVAQHVDGAALGNLSLQPREQLAPCRSVLGERERFRRFGLGCVQERRKLGEIDAVLAIVIAGVAAIPTNPAVTVRGLRYGPRLGRLARDGLSERCR